MTRQTLTVQVAPCTCLYIESGQIKVYDCSDATFGFWPLKAGRPVDDLAPADESVRTEVTQWFERRINDAVKLDNIKAALA